MAIMPAAFVAAQDKGISTVKDGQTAVGNTFNTDTAKQDSTPALSKRELRRQRVARRNLHYNILGGPSYTPDFGLLIGGSALMTFRMNPSDTTQQRSVVPVAIALMFNGGLNLFSKPQLFFKGDRFRIFGQFSYRSTPGSCSAWVKAISLPARRSTSTMITCTIRPNTLSTSPLTKLPAARTKAIRTSVPVSASC